MEYSEWLPPWQQIKEDAAQSGFVDDGYGDIAPSDWDCVARLVWRTILRERARCANVCEELPWSEIDTDSPHSAFAFAIRKHSNAELSGAELAKRPTQTTG